MEFIPLTIFASVLALVWLSSRESSGLDLVPVYIGPGRLTPENEDWEKELIRAPLNILGAIGDWVGSAIGAVANVVKVVPTFGATAAGVLNSASALLKGGTVTTSTPGGGSTTISTAGNVTTAAGAQPPAKPAGWLSSLTKSKIFGIPVIVLVPGLILVVYLIWKRRKGR